MMSKKLNWERMTRNESKIAYQKLMKKLNSRPKQT